MAAIDLRTSICVDIFKEIKSNIIIKIHLSLNPNLLKQITNGNIYGYVGSLINNIKNNSVQNNLEPGYTIFYN